MILSNISSIFKSFSLSSFIRSVEHKINFAIKSDIVSIISNESRLLIVDSFLSTIIEHFFNISLSIFKSLLDKASCHDVVISHSVSSDKSSEI